MASPSKPKKTILVVDDQPANINILREILLQEYKIKASVTGEQAIQIALSQPQPDLILLDIMMPGMDGYETCHKLQDNPLTQGIPIIFVSAMNETTDEEKGFQCGGVDYIAKPVSPPIVKARVAAQILLKSTRDELEQQVALRTSELKTALQDLKDSHEQVIQQEKLASIGQLAAGVAHEINNPTGFVSSNLNTLNKYVDKLHTFLDATDQATALSKDEKIIELTELRKQLKIDFILEDIKDIVSESHEGIDRIKKIVMGLKNFTRKDKEDLVPININDCLENTLDIIWNELKYKAVIEKDYGDLPETSGFPQQLSQVFMNLLVNAAHAIEDKGIITIKTRQVDGNIQVSITDSGSGISAENLAKIFEPFFTTKELGKGTGLGMSIASEIIKKHEGEISVRSELGKGTTFVIGLPIKKIAQ